MSLRSKITWVLVAAIAVFALAIDRIQESVFQDRFVQVEQESAKTDLARVSQGLEDAVDDLDRLCQGLARWTPMHAYSQAPNAEFPSTEFASERLSALELDLVYVITPPAAEAGVDDFLHPEKQLPQVAWSTLQDPDRGAALRLSDFPTQSFAPNHPLLQGVEHEGSVAGVLQTEHLPLLVSAHRVTRSDGSLDEGDGAVLILGRFLGGNLETTLEAKTHTQLDLWQADGRHELPVEAAEAYAVVSATAAPHLIEPGNNFLYAYGSFDDIRSRPEILLRVTVPQDITAIGSMALRSGGMTLLTAGGILLLVLMGLLKRIVLDPISALTQHAVRVGSEDGYRGQCNLERSDELGTLSTEFETMLQRLEQAKRDLMDTARRAGMSEIATGILHNVGNVLNSVNISASLASQQAEEMSVDDLEQLSSILHEHANDLAGFISSDPKGQHMLPFLGALTGQLAEERDVLKRELTTLGEGVEHICDLIKSQQAYAIKTDLQESLDLRSILEEAVHITEQATASQDGVLVEVNMPDLPRIEADRHRLLEILVNLVQNGRQALVGAKTADARIRVEARTTDDRIKITVSDNGPGIPDELLAQVFSLGFTTKPTGMGYGLHTAANAATEMRGKLSASSSTSGAVFTLDIPFLVTTHAS